MNGLPRTVSKQFLFFFMLFCYPDLAQDFGYAIVIGARIGFSHARRSQTARIKINIVRLDEANLNRYGSRTASYS